MDDPLSPTEALCLAAGQGNCEQISILLDEGCDINALDEDGLSVLSWAIHNYQVEAVQLLLELGADPNIRDVTNNGFTPLDDAVQLKARNRLGERIAIVQLLLAHGADPTIRSWMQVNALERAAERGEQDRVYRILKHHCKESRAQ